MWVLSIDRASSLYSTPELLQSSGTGEKEAGFFHISASSLEKEMAIHSSILAWRIAQTEESGRLQSMGSQRVGHYWATNTHTHTHTRTASSHAVPLVSASLDSSFPLYNTVKSRTFESSHCKLSKMWRCIHMLSHVSEPTRLLYMPHMHILYKWLGFCVKLLHYCMYCTVTYLPVEHCIDYSGAVSLFPAQDVWKQA